MAEDGAAPEVIGAEEQKEAQAPEQVAMEDLPPHLACIAELTKVEIREKASLIEALTAAMGQEIEMANKYRIFSDGGEEELFFAVEESSCCQRQMKQCAPDCAPWNVSILLTKDGAYTPAFKLTRPCTFTFMCCNRPKVDLIDVTTDTKLGSMVDPYACCDMTFKIRDAEDNPVLKANGGCCQPGLICPLPCGPCAEVNFPVSDAATGEEVGHIKKKVPGCCTFFFASDVDNYYVDFGGVKNPNYKMLLIGLSIFMDFRYFNDNKNDDKGGGAAANAA